MELLAPLIVCRSVGEREETEGASLKQEDSHIPRPRRKYINLPLYVVTSIGKKQKRKRNSFKEKDDEKRIKKTNKTFTGSPKGVA